MKFSISKVFLTVAIAFFLCLLQSSLVPDYNREYKLDSPALSSKITIYRDKHAIPHIKANNINDAMYAMGFAHAQDRLWSIDIRRRMARGRMSEIFGSSTLDFDRFMRNVGLDEAARESAAVLTESERKLVGAYVEGFNAYVKTLTFLPLQYWLTWTTFEEYTIEDVSAFYKFIGFTTSFDWLSELIGEELLARVGPERAWRYFVTNNEFDETVIITDEELKENGLFNANMSAKVRKDGYKQFRKRFEQAKKGSAAKAPEIKPAYRLGGIDELLWKEVFDFSEGIRGSNSWVIHGNHTASGKPLLANDPHLPNSAPSIWYQVEIKLDNQTLMGASVAGIPGVAIGRNDFIAWGITTIYGDNSDIFEETLNDAQTEYLYEGKYYPLKAREEVFKVRFGGEHKETFYSTRNGPILKSYNVKQVPLLRFPLTSNKNYSFAWTGRVTRDTQFKALPGMCMAKTLKEFEDAVKYFTLNSNLVFATVNGDIGYYSAGIYVKRDHFDTDAFAKNGSSAQDAWKGMLHPNELVLVKNPKRGYIVTANNKIASDNIKTGMCVNMFSTARARRATDMVKDRITKGKKFDVEYMRKMQLDTVDVYAAEVVKNIIKIYNRNKQKIKGLDQAKIEKSLSYWRNWDGDHGLDSIAGTVFAVWQKLYNQKLFRRDGFSEIEREKMSNSLFVEQYKYARIREWATTDPKPIDDLVCQAPDDEDGQEQKPYCIYALLKSLEQTADYLVQNYGEDESRWAWGQIRKMQHPYLPFSLIPLIKKIFTIEEPAGGNAHTLNVATHDEGKSFDAMFSANYRMVVDFGNLDQSYYTIDTGISENPFSPNFHDQRDLHSKGDKIQMISYTKSKETFAVTNLTRV